jgi:hypothetical protein
MKTNELTGAALDWAVAKCEGLAVSDRATKWRAENCPHLYSTDWAQGGPIIEREVPILMKTWGGDWIAQGSYDIANDKEAQRYYGTTPLIAAMRCFVASKLGDEIVLPKELT